MSISQQISNYLFPRLFPGKMKELTRMVDVFEYAYEKGGLIAPPGKVLEMLAENGQLMDLIIRTRGAAFATGFRITERDRISAIRQARYMADTNANVERAVQIWTDFGMGQRVTLRSEDKAANEVVNEFWMAQRNANIIGQRNLQERSEDALNEGELLFIFWYSPLDGEATIRTIPTDQIEILWEDPENRTIPLYYKHHTSDGDLYYPDWRATDEQLVRVTLPPGARRADQLSAGSIEINGRPEASTQAVAMWASRKRNRTMGRGMPQFLNAFEWAKILTDFMGDRAAVARKAAMYTEKVKIDGGSRMVNSFKSRLQSSLASSTSDFRDRNPPYAAASDWIENEAVSREWMSRDTGAASARFDGRMLGGQLSVATGVGLHWLGFPDAITGGLATAEELKTPFYQQIERYQLWLSSVFEEIGQVVLFLKAANGGSVDADAVVMVDMETPLFVLMEEIVALMTETVAAVEKGILDGAVGREIMRQLYLVALQRIGVRKPDKLFNTAANAEARLPDALALVMDNWKAGKVTDTAVVSYLLGQLEELASEAGGH